MFPSQDSCYLGRQEEKLHDDRTLGEQEGRKAEVLEKTKGYAAQSNRSTFSRVDLSLSHSLSYHTNLSLFSKLKPHFALNKKEISSEQSHKKCHTRYLNGNYSEQNPKISNICAVIEIF